MSSSQCPNPDDPIKWLVEDYYGRKTRSSYENAMSVFYNGRVAFVPWLNERDMSPRDVTTSVVRDYFDDLKDEYRPSTQREYASRLNLVYRKLLNRGVVGIECNPVDRVLDEDILDDVATDPKPIYDKEIITDLLYHVPPPIFVACLIMAKTTRRVGGVVNLDLIDVNIDHPGADWEVVSPISDKPDHIYFGPQCSGGEIFRGEKRETGTKTETHTMIPIDDELKQVLIWWLSIRRGSEKEGALITNSGSIPTKRTSRDSVATDLKDAAKELEANRSDFSSDVVNPHYFRHWTTTTMRDRVNDSVVDYMRGDKKKISDQYTHYSENKKEQWLNNIPNYL